jgi:cobalt-zinc-cadmium efflux system outer membrane protein
MRAGVICAVVVAVLYPARSGAQALSLSEADALARLTAENPRVQAARAGVELARAEVLAAGRWPNPSLSFTHEAAGGVSEGLFTIAQPLPLTGRRGLEVRSAAARADAAADRADDRVRRLRAETRLALVEVWAAQERERELMRRTGRMREVRTMIARREDEGDAAGFDLLRAEREAIDAEIDLATAATDRRRAQTLLASVLQIADPASIVVPPSPSDSAPPPPLAELTAHADAARADLRAFRNEADAASFAMRAAARRRLPEPEVVAGTKSSNAGSGDTGAIVGLRVSLPLFDRGRPEQAAATARADQARVESEALRQSLHAQIAAARASLVERQAAAERYRAALAAADEVERIARVSYDAGERGILELLDAHRVASSARIRLIELDAAVRQGQIELEFASAWDVR